MKKALIVGMGYVGSNVAKHWKNQYVVEGTTTTQEKVPELEKICKKVVLIDPNNKNQWREIVYDKDVILVCVAPKYIPGENVDYRTTYLETAIALSNSLAGIKGRPQLVYTSSTSVYDRKGTDELKETSSLSEEPNQKILRETEETFLSLQPNLPVTILRLSQIIGHPPRDFRTFCRRMSGRSFPGNGEEPTNLIHVDDITKAIDFVIEKKLKGVFNISQTIPLNRKQIFEKFCEELKIPPPIYSGEIKDSHLSKKEISSRKIQEEGFIFNKSNYELDKM